jgi:hypothetical protein
MNQRRSLVGWNTFWIAAAVLCSLVMSPLGPPSTAVAQDRTLCEVAGEASETSPLFCVGTDIGMVGQLTMIGTQRASVAVRQLAGLVCYANGYDDVGDWIGSTGRVTWEEGAAERCFRIDEGSCFTSSPVATVDMNCWLQR